MKARIECDAPNCWYVWRPSPTWRIGRAEWFKSFNDALQYLYLVGPNS